MPLIIALIFMGGCSSSKKGSNSSIVKVTYHDITSRNNLYFNAKEKLKLTQQNIASTYQEDYSEILPLYDDRDLETAKGFNGEFDEIIKKASFAIRLHSPQNDSSDGQNWRKTQSRWGDDNYLVIGKAYYLKGDLQTAQKTFQYITAEYKRLEEEVEKSSYSKSKTSKKKKLKQRKKNAKKKKKKRLKELKKKKKQRKKGKSPKTSKDKDSKKKDDDKEAKDEEGEEEKVSLWDYLQHQKARPKAMIWLVDTYTAQKEYKKAEAVLTLIEADENFPVMHKMEVEMARANLYLEKGDLTKALAPLNELVNNIKRKRKKVRYVYILAQVHEQLGNYSGALDYYKQVLKSRPVFDMEFNAKMSIARIAKDQNESYDEIKKMLTKLLKDGKNSDFFDQIHYALAELELEYYHKDEAKENLLASIEKSTTNTDQKALSYLKLAELYYDEEEYVSSQAYYDSTLTVLSTDHKRYLEVNERNAVLKDLVKYIEVIAVEDSLQKIAKMSPEERDAFLEKMIKDKQKEEAKQKKEEESNTGVPAISNNTNNKNNNNNNSSGSDWYFYNSAARGRGFTDFQAKWGTRKLEDNWRRSDKSTIEEDLEDGEEDLAEESFEETDDYLLDDTDKEKKALLEGLPLTEEALKASNEKMIEAYYKLGGIYRIQLDAEGKAISSFEGLLARFPDNQYKAESYYNLYLLYSEMGDEIKANWYKRLLFEEYPNSKFTMIIKDPDYLKRAKREDEEVTRYYEETYKLYMIDSLEMVFNRITMADSLFTVNHLKPKFDLLYAFAIGKSDSLEGYINALQHVVETYPGNEVERKADEILTYLMKTENRDYEIKINAIKYDYNEKSIHYVVVAYSSETIKSSDLKTSIAQFNDANRSLDNLKVNSLVLNETHTLVRVSEFLDMKQALNYYNLLKSSDKAFEGMPKELLNFMIISDVNFNKVISNRELDSYLDFFNVRYIKQ